MASRKYIVVGNGVAGVTAAFTLREREPRAEITMVSGEGPYFFSRTALMYALMGKMELRQLEPYERPVWKQRRIELVQDWVTDLDAGGRILTTRGGRTLEFDSLLLATGSQPRQPAWAGLAEAKTGVVNFVSRQDLERCEQWLPETRQAVVVGGGLIGVELVECLAHHGIPVKFLVREGHFFRAALSAAEGAMVERHLRSHGVELRTNTEVARVTAGPQGRVCGVQTKSGETTSGETLAADLLGVAIGVEPAVGWLRAVRTPPELGRGIRVNGAFATSLPQVFAAGDCAELAGGAVEQLWYSAKRQGELAAQAMLGDAVQYAPPTFFNSSKFFDLEFTCVGAAHAAPGEREHYWAAPDRPVSVRIIEHGGRFAGVSLLGSRWRHEYFARWIAEGRTVGWVVENLRQAQFDGEFGRTRLDFVRPPVEELV